MPSPWIQSELNPGWIAGQTYPVKSIIEFIGYDDSARGQGKVLACVQDTMERNDDGCWLSVKVICVEDPDLAWWLKEGPGAKMKNNFFLHLCIGKVSACKRVKKKELSQFHTDALRTVSVRDIEARASQWWTKNPAKKDFEAFRSEVVKDPPVKPPQPRGADLNFEPSDLDEELGNLEHASKEDRRGSHGDLSAKLAKLKAEAAPAEGSHRRRRTSETEVPAGAAAAGKRKPALRSQALGRGDEVPKEKKRKVTVDKSPAWFGRPEEPDRGSGEYESYYSESEEPQKKPPEGEKKKRTSKSKKPSKGKRSRKADRGPFGSGRKVTYRGKEESLEESDEGQGSDDSSFQAGVSEKRSQQLVLMEYADQKPGRLAARLLQKMALLSSRTGTPMSSVLAANRNKTPPAAVQYYLTVLYPQHKEKMNLRLQRELRTLSQSLDYLSLGDIERCADLISQRLKALEMTIHDQNWSRAQFLELIPLESAGLADTEEQRMATKEQVLEAKMKKALNVPRGGGKGAGLSQEGEKGDSPRGRWKGGKRGEKGRGKGATGDVVPPKTPVA